MKIEKIIVIAVSFFCLIGIISIPVSAKDFSGDGYVQITYVDSSGAEFTGDPNYYPLDKVQTKRSARASYNLKSSKDIRQRNCADENRSGFDHQCYGWVEIVDKQSGTPLRHSTTAAVGNSSSGSMYKGAVRETGEGKVYATSDWVHKWAVPRIFWDWIN